MSGRLCWCCHQQIAMSNHISLIQRVPYTGLTRRNLLVITPTRADISNDGVVNEYKIPTANSRPIAVVPDQCEPYMWFTEEAGVKIGKIDMNGNMTEYRVPALQKNDILASLSFDPDGNLWVQVYVDAANPNPAGYDYIIMFDKSIRQLQGDDLSGIPFVMHTIPSKMSMMHRIRPDHDGNLWFTEMMTDKLGKIKLV